MWVSIAVAVISGVLAGGVSPFLFFRQEKDARSLDNEAKTSAEWKKLYEEEREERKERDVKIDHLYEKINTLRDDKTELAKRIAELEVENTRLKLLTCEIPSCPKRKPQTGY